MRRQKKKKREMTWKLLIIVASPFFFFFSSISIGPNSILYLPIYRNDMHLSVAGILTELKNLLSKMTLK